MNDDVHEHALADLPGSTRAAVLTLAGLCGLGLLGSSALAFGLIGLAQLRASGAGVPDGAGAALFRFAAGSAAFALCRGVFAAMIMRRSRLARTLAGLLETAAIALGLLSWHGGPGYDGPRLGDYTLPAEITMWFGATAGPAVSLAIIVLLWSRASETWCDR